MNCPFFDADAPGLCLAGGRPPMPPRERTEDYCLNMRFADCPLYALHETGEVLKDQAEGYPW